jgi:predicted glycoside hydrolase/deacetylase ChbG (UPF0249 family)
LLQEQALPGIELVINADDFGLTEGVSAGIAHAINAGAVTSTTAMACVPGAGARLRQWAPRIAGHIGAHLQLTSGTPLLPSSQVSSLVQEDGKFPSKRKEIQNPRAEEIFAEWEAQIKFLVGAGIELTHLDSHHHVHGLPFVFPTFCELARKYELRVRSFDLEMDNRLRTAGVPTLGRTLTDWYGGELSVRSLLRVLERGREKFPQAERFEVMCHPGWVEEELGTLSRYVGEREEELRVLCDPELEEQLVAGGFKLSQVRALRGSVCAMECSQ